MIDLTTLKRRDNVFIADDLLTGKDIEIKEDFPIEDWDCPEAFNMAGIRGYEPMLAKEIEDEETQDEKMNDPSYYLEEKFDGTRALVYFLSQPVYESDKEIGFCRVFSRRVSKKTGFYVENTDSLPQIREIDEPSLAGTILDGEMFINGLPFKEVASTLNCTWDKAIDRQIEKGFISLHAFDILFYKGVDLRKMPLERRKVYLHLAIKESNSRYIEEVVYNNCGQNVDTRPYESNHGDLNEVYKSLAKEGSLESYPHFSEEMKNGAEHSLSPRAFYEYIVGTGGEGLILKPKNGLYKHKRGWEYSKVKKFLTREMIVIGFDEPTKEYSGKDVRKWAYWIENKTNKRLTGNFYGDDRYTPVTKFYYYNQVGNLLLGVLIPKDDFNSLKKNKRGDAYIPSDIGLDPRLDSEYFLMEVCECAGFDDETREYFTKKRDELVGTVVEVKANELFRDTGKMRHPRYLRQRFDKEPERCTWSDHIGDSEVTR